MSLTRRYNRPVRKQRGFSLVEVLVSLVILAIVITTTLAMFVERNRRIAQANETILAYQILWNEAEVRRRIDFADLENPSVSTGIGVITDGNPPEFVTETTLLKPLKPFKTIVTVTETKKGLKNVDLTISWMKGTRTAKLTLTRADTGGENLW